MQPAPRIAGQLYKLVNENLAPIRHVVVHPLRVADLQAHTTVAVGDAQATVQKLSLAARQVGNRMEQVVALDLGVIPAGIALAKRKPLAAHPIGAGNSGSGGLTHAAQPILGVAPITL